MRALVIALLTAGFVCDVAGQELTGTVHVEVATTTGDPVADADVVAAGITERTDDLGVAVLRVPIEVERDAERLLADDFSRLRIQ